MLTSSGYPYFSGADRAGIHTHVSDVSYRQPRPLIDRRPAAKPVMAPPMAYADMPRSWIEDYVPADKAIWHSPTWDGIASHYDDESQA